MMDKKLVAVMALLLLASAACAQDGNIADGQLQSQMQQLQLLLAAINTQMSQAKVQVVTAQFDAKSEQMFQQFGDKLALMEQKLSLVEERFALLKTDLSNKVDASQQAVVDELSTKTDTASKQAADAIMQNTREMTNPIRINLPNFGLWLMVTAAFMLFAGMRFRSALRDAEREQKIIKEAPLPAANIKPHIVGGIEDALK